MAKPRRRIEMIEEYLMPNDEHSDYQYNDNHGVLVRCRDCKYGAPYEFAKGRDLIQCMNDDNPVGDNGCFPIAGDWYCADGERRDDDGDDNDPA